MLKVKNKILLLASLCAAFNGMHCQANLWLQIKNTWNNVSKSKKIYTAIGTAAALAVGFALYKYLTNKKQKPDDTRKRTLPKKNSSNTGNTNTKNKKIGKRLFEPIKKQLKNAQGAVLSLLKKHEQMKLFEAVKKNDLKMFNKYFTPKTNVNMIDKKGKSLLYLVMKNYQPNTKIIKQLLENGANPIEKDDEGVPLILAAMKVYNRYKNDISGNYPKKAKNAQEIAFLFSNNIKKNINMPIKDGKSLLYHVMQEYQPSTKIVKYLLENGANPIEKDDKGDPLILKAMDKYDLYNNIITSDPEEAKRTLEVATLFLCNCKTQECANIIINNTQIHSDTKKLFKKDNVKLNQNFLLELIKKTIKKEKEHIDKEFLVILLENAKKHKAHLSQDTLNRALFCLIAEDATPKGLQTVIELGANIIAKSEYRSALYKIMKTFAFDHNNRNAREIIKRILTYCSTEEHSKIIIKFCKRQSWLSNDILLGYIKKIGKTTALPKKILEDIKLIDLSIHDLIKTHIQTNNPTKKYKIHSLIINKLKESITNNNFVKILDSLENSPYMLLKLFMLSYEHQEAIIQNGNATNILIDLASTSEELKKSNIEKIGLKNFISLIGSANPEVVVTLQETLQKATLEYIKDIDLKSIYYEYKVGNKNQKTILKKPIQEILQQRITRKTLQHELLPMSLDNIIQTLFFIKNKKSKNRLMKTNKPLFQEKIQNIFNGTANPQESMEYDILTNTAQKLYPIFILATKEQQERLFDLAPKKFVKSLGKTKEEQKTKIEHFNLGIKKTIALYHTMKPNMKKELKTSIQKQIAKHSKPWNFETLVLFTKGLPKRDRQLMLPALALKAHT